MLLKINRTVIKSDRAVNYYFFGGNNELQDQ
jgi:hypothetical protein